jgi:hypothetical protein
MTMKVLRMIFGVAVAVALLASAQAQEEKKKPTGIQGVKGTVFIIDGNKNKDTKLTVQAHDHIVIEWTYPINPPFPKSASQKSSHPDIVKDSGVHRVVNVKGLLGVGRLGAIFTAQKPGNATLTFEINRGKDDIKLTCEVEVK